MDTDTKKRQKNKKKHRVLFASFFTTVSRQSACMALSFLLFPRKWKKRAIGGAVLQRESDFLEYLGYTGNLEKDKIAIISLYNGRSALYHGIKSLGIKKGDEIILQAYTCISVANAIIATGAKPIYVDIDPSTLNIDPQKIQTAITSRTKAILVQHTFGIPAELDQITQQTQKHGLYLIEDCAHALGATYRDQKVGTFGDVAIFSTARDKIISSVNGGLLLLRDRGTISSKKQASTIRSQLRSVPKKLIAKNLLYEIISWLAYMLYDTAKIGKALYYVSGKGKANIFPPIIGPGEYSCQNNDFDYAMPNSLAHIASKQLPYIDTYNKMRCKNAHILAKNFGTKCLIDNRTYTYSVYLRCVFLASDIQDRHNKEKYLKQHNIYTGDRYQQPIGPKDAQPETALYKQSSCPIAEGIAQRTMNIPNHYKINAEDIGFIVEKLSDTFK